MMSFNFPVLADVKPYMVKPTVPNYEICNLITVQSEAGPYQIQDSNCLSRNKNAKDEYNAKLLAYNNSFTILDHSTTTATKPVEPTYAVCTQTDDGSGHFYSDYACEAENQRKQQAYSLQSQAWEVMQNNTALQTQAQIAADQARADALMKSQSASEALQKAISENQRASAAASKSSQEMSAASTAAGMAYAGTCAAMGGCQQPLLAMSIAFGIMSALSGKQSSENQFSGQKACEAQTKISSSTIDCGPTPAPWNAEASTPKASSLVPSVFDTNGNCVASDKSLCKAALAALPAGTNIKDVVKGASTFTSPFTINPDGSAKLKDGRVIKASDLKNAASLQAAGFSSEQAQAALAALSKAAAFGVPSSALDAASVDLKKRNTDFTGMAMAGSGSGSGSGEGKNGALGSSGKLDSNNIGGGKGGKDRNPAGEGLTRDFNGEAIGSAGDDIFSMMNRRYKMKTSQDSFLSN